ncbi:MAG: hypothetical protein WBE20_12200 [Candidatus Acidiferrales bacterium]
MKITVVGWLEIAGIGLAVFLFISYLQKQQKPEPLPGQAPVIQAAPSEQNLAD